jgi:hypothetical protein
VNNSRSLKTSCRRSQTRPTCENHPAKMLGPLRLTDCSHSLPGSEKLPLAHLYRSRAWRRDKERSLFFFPVGGWQCGRQHCNHERRLRAEPAGRGCLGQPVERHGTRGYNVYRGLVSVGPYALLKAAPVPSANFGDGSVTAAQKSYYLVTRLQAVTSKTHIRTKAAFVIP